MTKMFPPLVAFVAAYLLMYLAFAFIAWELDPSQWNKDGRFVFVALGAALGVVAALGVKEYYDQMDS